MAKIKLKITQVRSLIGAQHAKHKVVMESLGFKKHQQTLYKNDTPQIRGMIEKVRHLVVWEQIDEKAVPGPVSKSPGFTILSGKAAAAKKRVKKKAKSKAKKSPGTKTKAKKSTKKKAE